MRRNYDLRVMEAVFDPKMGARSVGNLVEDRANQGSREDVSGVGKGGGGGDVGMRIVVGNGIRGVASLHTAQKSV
ncbi:MAG: hypothetical protein JSW00_07345 [Thermoplasmata archaeon]|nr:MAG: hypothetical protein JSW00_07345 [Thermoplasmata archaeon]